MTFSQSLSWAEPLELAAAIDQPYWALLYSGVMTDYSGRYSLLACDLAERIEGADFTALQKKLSADRHALENSWFGYLGYRLKNCLESLPPDQPNWLRLPALSFMRFHSVYRFDHLERTLTRWSDMDSPPLSPISLADAYPPAVTGLHAAMAAKDYLEKAAQVIEAIHRGDLYQANLTRKFNGRFAQAPDAFALFRRLCAKSPAPYSAYLRLDDKHILSSSPELFLNIDAAGNMRARPIKGSAPRFADPQADARSREGLAASGKDRAENLMIVDLMRNDFSRSCILGSVRVDSLFDITSHATIHHMSSTVTGRKRNDCPVMDAVRYCFPPGSMTGAPKLAAMKLCSRLEMLERGVYSGAIGWFGGDGACELSVVIRTLILKEARFEFQVGGGIVADSTPQKELQEIADKSAGILAALGVDSNEFMLK